MTAQKQHPSFLIAGLGSIGQRHLRNLVSLGIRDITLFRTGHATLSDANSNQFPVERDLKRALAQNPTAVIVSNPTSLHMNVALPAAETGCHLLLEKPISHSMENVDKLRQRVQKNNVKVLVGFQFRFHPSFRKIKQWLDDGRIDKVISAHVHWGEHLPAWHPWEDYRKGYSARQDMGGGVVLTLCHPFDYLRWLIGEVQSVSAAMDKLSDLEIDTEDTAIVTLRFVSGAVGSVYLDYIQRPPQHDLIIVGQKGTITWNNTDSRASLHPADAKEAEVFCPPEGFDRNTMFLEEIVHFIDSIKNDQQPDCTLEDGIRALQIALAVKQTAAERRIIEPV